MCAMRRDRRRPELDTHPGGPKPLTRPANTVGEIFSDVVRQIRGCMSPGNPPVDVELRLDSVTVSERGFLVFTKKTSSTAMTLRLATRITAPEEGKD